MSDPNLDQLQQVAEATAQKVDVVACLGAVMQVAKDQGKQEIVLSLVNADYILQALRNAKAAAYEEAIKFIEAKSDQAESRGRSVATRGGGSSEHFSKGMAAMGREIVEDMRNLFDTQRTAGGRDE